MYNIGDRIVYPMHGAGIIDDVITQKLDGVEKKYYAMTTYKGDIRLMIPVDRCDSIGVRAVIDREEIGRVLEELGAESTPMSSNWNRRYRANMDKIRTGDIFQVAEVTRNLYRIEKEKKLSNGEKKMLGNALAIMESEFILAMDITPEEAEKMICEVI